MGDERVEKQKALGREIVERLERIEERLEKIWKLIVKVSKELPVDLDLGEPEPSEKKLEEKEAVEGDEDE